jgi:hypothetical protein
MVLVMQHGRMTGCGWLSPLLAQTLVLSAKSLTMNPHRQLLSAQAIAHKSFKLNPVNGPCPTTGHRAGSGTRATGFIQMPISLEEGNICRRPSLLPST